MFEETEVQNPPEIVADAIPYGVIYVITNTVNGKQYVGQTTREDPIVRWKAHVSLARGRGKSYICAAIRKYGEEAFRFEVISSANDQEHLNFDEALAIVSLGTMAPNGYNLKEGGSSGKASAELRIKLKAIHSTPEARKLQRRVAAAAHARPEVKERHRRAVRDSYLRPEVVANHKAFWDSPGARDAQSAKLAASLSRPEIREKLSKASKAAASRPGAKERASATSIAVFKRPGVKARHKLALEMARQRPEWGRMMSAVQKETQNRPDVIAKQKAAHIGRRWINNATEQTTIKSGDPLPENWIYGMLRK